jgi:DNA-binding NarL/FixJ family response regulator
MADSSPIQVLIVSNYPVTRAGLRAILEGSDSAAVAGESSIEEMPGQAASLRPDAVLLDVSTAEQDELEILSRLMAELPGVGVVVLSGDPGDASAREALQAGVRGYLLRDASRDEIVEAVRAVAQGLTVLHPSVAAALLAGSRLQPPAGPDEPLTARELEVLRLMAQGLPSKTIASRLRISEHTVKFHVGAILGKLGAASRTEAVTVAIRRGLIAL